MLARHKWALGKPYEKCCLQKDAFRATLHFIIRDQIRKTGLGFNITSGDFINVLKTNILDVLEQTFEHKRHVIKLDNSFKMFLDIVRAIYILFGKFKDKVIFAYYATIQEGFTRKPLIELFNEYKKEGIPPLDERLFYIVVGANIYFRWYFRFMFSTTYNPHYCVFNPSNKLEHIEIPMRLHLYHIIYDLILRPAEGLHYMTHNIKKQMESCENYNIWEHYNFKYWRIFQGDKTSVRLFYKCRNYTELWIPSKASLESSPIYPTHKF